MESYIPATSLIIAQLAIAGLCWSSEFTNTQGIFTTGLMKALFAFSFGSLLAGFVAIWLVWYQGLSNVLKWLFRWSIISLAVHMGIGAVSTYVDGSKTTAIIESFLIVFTMTAVGMMFSKTICWCNEGDEEALVEIEVDGDDKWCLRIVGLIVVACLFAYTSFYGFLGLPSNGDGYKNSTWGLVFTVLSAGQALALYLSYKAAKLDERLNGGYQKWA